MLIFRFRGWVLGFGMELSGAFEGAGDLVSWL